MKEEIKNNALSDEELNEVAGGAGDPMEFYCYDCKNNRIFYRDDEGKLTCEVCGGHRFSGEFPHI